MMSLKTCRFVSFSGSLIVVGALRSVVRYSSAPKVIHRKGAFGTLKYINIISWFGIMYQTGT